MNDISGAWPAELAKGIGSAIRSTREMQHVSAVKLAARATELGFPIHRVAISKLESGERAVTLPELIVLAAALNTAFVEHHREQVEHTRGIIKSLEEQRNQIIFWLTDEGDTDGG